MGIAATDWIVRVYTPAWLRLAGLTEQADRLEALPDVTPASSQVVLETLAVIDRDATRAAKAANVAVGVKPSMRGAVWAAEAAVSAMATATHAVTGEPGYSMTVVEMAASSTYMARAAALWGSWEEPREWRAGEPLRREGAGQAFTLTVGHLRRSAHDLVTRSTEVVVPRVSKAARVKHVMNRAALAKGLLSVVEAVVMPVLVVAVTVGTLVVTYLVLKWLL